MFLRVLSALWWSHHIQLYIFVLDICWEFVHNCSSHSKVLSELLFSVFTSSLCSLTSFCLGTLYIFFFLCTIWFRSRVDLHLCQSCSEWNHCFYFLLFPSLLMYVNHTMQSSQLKQDFESWSLLTQQIYLHTFVTLKFTKKLQSIACRENHFFSCITEENNTQFCFFNHFEIMILRMLMPVATTPLKCAQFFGVPSIDTRLIGTVKIWFWLLLEIAQRMSSKFDASDLTVNIFSPSNPGKKRLATLSGWAKSNCVRHVESSLIMQWNATARLIHRLPCVRACVRFPNMSRRHCTCSAGWSFCSNTSSGTFLPIACVCLWPLFHQPFHSSNLRVVRVFHFQYSSAKPVTWTFISQTETNATISSLNLTLLLPCYTNKKTSNHKIIVDLFLFERWKTYSSQRSALWGATPPEISVGFFGHN